VATGALFILVPVGYGAVSVFGKLSRVPATYTLGPSGFYDPLLTESDLAPVERRIIGRFGPETDVWYICDPATALDFDGRVLAVDADFLSIDRLAGLHFSTTAPVRLTVLMPPRFENEGKGAVIRGAFAGAGPWRHDSVPGSKYDVWTTVVAR
jgi:hypothetical protein